MKMGQSTFAWISTPIWLFKKHHLGSIDDFSPKVAHTEVVQTEQKFLQGSKYITENTKAHY